MYEVTIIGFEVTVSVLHHLLLRGNQHQELLLPQVFFFPHHKSLELLYQTVPAAPGVFVPHHELLYSWTPHHSVSTLPNKSPMFLYWTPAAAHRV